MNKRSEFLFQITKTVPTNDFGEKAIEKISFLCGHKPYFLMMQSVEPSAIVRPQRHDAQSFCQYAMLGYDNFHCHFSRESNFPTSMNVSVSI